MCLGAQEKVKRYFYLFNFLMSERPDAHPEIFIVFRNSKTPVVNMVKLKTSFGDTICIQNLYITCMQNYSAT